MENKNRLNKSKIISTSIIIIILIGVIALIVISHRNNGIIGGFQTSNVQFDVTYKNGSDTIATAFDFKYDNIKKEVSTVKVELQPSSIIKILSLDVNSNCTIIIYKGNSEIWKQVIEPNETYADFVKEEGEYELSFTMDTGKGEGSVVFS
ncbi:MAG: hypothetical protein LBM93_04225 [Oscillospiraceae bacterium]|jgi:hypothetical protein|nr:hypothetical protein [Oscillospiraceae bacterium]